MLSSIWLFATAWTIACQTPLPMGILQARILEFPCPPPGHPPNPGIQLGSPALQAGSLPAELLGKIIYRRETCLWDRFSPWSACLRSLLLHVNKPPKECSSSANISPSTEVFLFYLFFGYAGSLMLHRLFSHCVQWELLSSCGVWAPGHVRSSWTRDQTQSPALAGGFFITEPPRKFPLRVLTVHAFVIRNLTVYCFYGFL